jgi:predicted nucleic acid-binding protein
VGLLKDAGAGPVALDTAVFIFYIEEHPTHLPVVARLFEAVAEGRLRATASALALMEVLAVPYEQGDLARAERYETLLTRSRGLRLVGVSASVLRLAAHLRATTRARTPDAIHLASALAARCTSFVTHDRALPRIPGLRILQLRDHASPPTSLHEPRPGSGARPPPPRRRRSSGRT